jgi:hypothetical protein
MEKYMSIIFDYTINDEIEKCTNIDDLNNFLMKNGHDTPDKQSTYLEKYMCVIYAKNMSTSDKADSDETQCKFLKNIFLEGDWRRMTNKYLLAEYDKLQKINL